MEEVISKTDIKITLQANIFLLDTQLGNIKKTAHPPVKEAEIRYSKQKGCVESLSPE